MLLWFSQIDQPYLPFCQRQETVPAYYWCIVDQFDIVHQKSTELFLTKQNAMSHHENTQITVSPFFRSFNIQIKKKTIPLDIKLLIKYLIIFLYKQNLNKIKDENCESSDNSELSQLFHYDGCFKEDKSIADIKLDRKDICKHAWEIKKKLRLEVSQIEIENTIDCFQYYATIEQIEQLLLSSIPIMYKYLFNEIVQ